MTGERLAPIQPALATVMFVDLRFAAIIHKIFEFVFIY
jgi:hypothetical protein